MDRFSEESTADLARNYRVSRELERDEVDEETGCPAGEMGALWMDAEEPMPRRAQMLVEAVLAQHMAGGLAAVEAALARKVA